MIRVSRLSIAPVRSLGLQHPPAVELTEAGVAEDRRFFLVDDRDHLVDRIVAGRLVQVSAWTDPEATQLRLAFPDGSSIDGPVMLGQPIEAIVHRRVAVGHVVVGPWADALEPYAGRRVRIVRCDRPGGTRIRDGRVRNAVSLVSDGSIARLAVAVDRDAVDARRFRMLIEVEGAGAHAEDAWIGGRIAIGTAELAMTKGVDRCAITTQDPDTGIRDLDTLRSIIGYRGMTDDRKVLFGIRGEVAGAGRIALGDEVRVVELAATAALPAMADAGGGR